MAPDRITSNTTLLETLRGIARKRAQEATAGAQTSPAGRENFRVSESARHDVQALRKRLKDFATETNMQDAQSMLKARSNVLREILLWEFGNDFRTDAQFLPMLDAINATLDADPHYQQRFVELMNDLRKFS